jgi:hypothetical protein
MMGDDRVKTSQNRKQGLEKGDNEAQLDELGNDPAQVGPRSAGQSASGQSLSEIEDANDESVEELADTDQALEAARVEGLEDAADHPERPTHTHLEYGRPDDVPPNRR